MSRAWDWRKESRFVNDRDLGAEIPSFPRENYLAKAGECTSRKWPRFDPRPLDQSSYPLSFQQDVRDAVQGLHLDRAQLQPR